MTRAYFAYFANQLFVCGDEPKVAHPQELVYSIRQMENTPELVEMRTQPTK